MGTSLPPASTKPTSRKYLWDRQNSKPHFSIPRFWILEGNFNSLVQWYLTVWSKVSSTISFHLQNLFFFNFFRKIKISRDSGGVRSSALDMFYIKDSTFDFLKKKYFLFFFSSKKISWKISKFRKFLKSMKISEISQNFPKKHQDFFFDESFFDEKNENLFFL